MPVDADLGGYAEVRASVQLDVEGTPWAVVERLRPSFEIHPTDRVTAEAVVEASMSQGRVLADEAGALIMDSEVGEMLEAVGCAYEPEPRYDAISDYLTVERLHVDVNTPRVDLTVGRQAVNWGSALVFHPTDLLQEVVATEPWRERRGLNAVKAVVPLGEHEVTALAAVADDVSALYDADDDDVPVAFAAKATARGLQADWSVVGRSSLGGDWFAGADLRGTLGVGWWVEGGWHGEEEAAEVVVGGDYSFPVLNTLYIAGEYRYDGTGADPEDYDFADRGGVGTVPIDCAYAPVETGTRTTLGKHFADGTVRLGITEDVSVSTVVIANLQDGTGMLVPDASATVGGRVAVHVGAQVPFGTGGEFRPDEDDLVKEFPPAGSVDLGPLLPDATLIGWVRTSF